MALADNEGVLRYNTASFFDRGDFHVRRVGLPQYFCNENLLRRDSGHTPHPSALPGGCLFVLSPKIAVPRRTQVDPSSMAASKSCDMPRESTSMPMAGSRRAAIASRSSRSLRK